MKKDRIIWVDLVKYICIFFVIASHLGHNRIAPYLRMFYEPFFLSGFLVVSGYTYRYRIGFMDHLKKKIYQLLVPWFTFSMFTRIVAQLRTFGIEKFLEDIKWNFLQIRGLDDGMWFVAALFIAYIPFYFLVLFYEKRQENASLEEKNKIRKFSPFLAVFLILFYYIYKQFMPIELFPWGNNALPWHIEYIPFAMGCMFIGYVLKEEYETRLNRLFIKPAFYFGVIVSYLLIIFIPAVLNIKGKGLLNCIYDCILTLVGIVFVCCIAKHMKPNAYRLYVGRNTLIYMGMQGKVLYVFETILQKLNNGVFIEITENPFLSILYSLLMAIFLSLVLMIPTFIINRYFPFMLGKKRTRTT